MASDDYFKLIGGTFDGHGSEGEASTITFLDLMRRQIVDRFRVLSGAGMQVVAVSLPGLDDGEDLPSNPGHPACAEHAASDYCRESWQLHLAELRLRPTTHWCKCKHKRLCAVVPLVCQGRCPAVMKLVCRASVGERKFKRHAELLDLLVRDFAGLQGELLKRVLSLAHLPEALPTTQPTDSNSSQSAVPNHPQILRALQYIEQHLSDPRLSVGHVAEELGIYPTYLSQLFVEQVGQRMSRFIAARRIEMAKHLLATTNCQIKRIALLTGHANPNWFCHVFGDHTGVTPTQYRESLRIPNSVPLKQDTPRSTV